MKVFRILFLLLITVLVPLNTQVTYFTNVSDKQIKVFQVRVAGEMFSDPFIELDDENRIEVNFDAFDPDSGQYIYNLVHCNADWTQSNLPPAEYMNGFQGSAIGDFASATGAMVQYTSYRLLFSNDDVQPKVSGSYALQVHNEDDPSQIVFTACFPIFGPMASVVATVSGNTDIDTNQSHQQVSSAINDKNFPITYPQTNLKIWICQSNRRDNAVTDLQPITILENQISYTNNQNLILPAGNEYRRMEFLSNKYNDVYVESISFYNPYYHVELITDYRRDQLSYQYDQDQDDRLFTRCSNCNDPGTEVGYYIVHFTLAMDLVPDGNVYLNGELYNNVLDEKSKVGYNPETHQYEKSVLLKQGSHNYQYLFAPNRQTAGQTGPIEGNFFQVENEYNIHVYCCPVEARYDRLIGVTSIRDTMPVL